MFKNLLLSLSISSFLLTSPSFAMEGKGDEEETNTASTKKPSIKNLCFKWDPEQNKFVDTENSGKIQKFEAAAIKIRDYLENCKEIVEKEIKGLDPLSAKATIRKLKLNLRVNSLEKRAKINAEFPLILQKALLVMDNFTSWSNSGFIDDLKKVPTGDYAKLPYETTYPVFMVCQLKDEPSQKIWLNHLTDLDKKRDELYSFYKPYKEAKATDYEKRVNKLNKKAKRRSEEEAKVLLENHDIEIANINTILTQYDDFIEILKDFDSQKLELDKTQSSFIPILTSTVLVDTKFS